MYVMNVASSFKNRFIFLTTFRKMISRPWFRSTDLWVMGPARFHCASLLHIYRAPLGPLYYCYNKTVHRLMSMIDPV